MASARICCANTARSLIACQARPFLDVVGENKSSVAPVIEIVDGFPIEFREKNECQRPVNLFRSIDKNITDPDGQPVLVQSYSVVEAGEGKELDLYQR